MTDAIQIRVSDSDAGKVIPITSTASTLEEVFDESSDLVPRPHDASPPTNPSHQNQDGGRDYDNCYADKDRKHTCCLTHRG